MVINQTNIDEVIISFDETNNVSLNDRLRRSIHRYLDILANRINHPEVNFLSNLIVWSDDADRAYNIAYGITKVFNNWAGHAVTLEELTFLDETKYEKMASYPIIMIQNYEGTDIDRFYEVMRKLENSDSKPSVVIACSSEVKDRIKSYEPDNYRLYNYMFNNKIFADCDNAETVLDFVLNQLAKDGYEFDDEFKDALFIYINSIYDEAVLKGNDFAYDLVNRIYQTHYSRFEPGTKLSSESVPFSRKAEAFLKQDTADETNSSKGDSPDPDKTKASEVSEEQVMTIPQYFKANAKGEYVYKHRAVSKEKTNIYFAALSALGREYRESRFTLYDNNDNAVTEGTSVYQLDSVPKIVAEKLRKEGDSLDKMILLCTEATLNPGNTTLIGEDGSAYNLHTSALDFFYDNVKTCLGDSLLLPEERVIIIRIDPKNPAEGIKKAVEHIIQQKAPHLYIDPHGGFRNTQMTSLAITSLLESTELAVIETVYDVHTAGAGKPISVYEGDETIRINDFVSGINEFLNHGKTASLEKFLEGKNDNLVSAMRKVSDGLSLGSTKLFDEGLNDLRYIFYITKHKTDEPYLSIFQQAIKSDYDNIFHENATTVDKIEWLIKKGFYQQALIFIESQMPDELEEKGIIKIQRNRIKLEKKTNIHTVDVFNGYIREASRNSPNVNSYPELHTISSKLNEVGEFTFKSNFKNEGTCPAGAFIVTVSGSSRADFNKLVNLHKALKGVRNSSAHGNNKKYELSSIVKCLKIYTELARGLYDSAA